MIYFTDEEVKKLDKEWERMIDDFLITALGSKEKEEREGKKKD